MTIKYLSLFSGIGGFEIGLENSKYEFECIGYSEVDKYAESIYRKQFPNHIGYGDATKIKTNELPDFDLLVGGFPCFTPDTLIQTDKGIKPITDVKNGDKVLTHKNRYMPIINKMVKPYNDIGYKIIIDDIEIKCTPEHPFYTYNNGKPTWKKAKDLTKQDYCFIPKKAENYDNIRYNTHDIDGSWIEIKNITTYGIDDLVYNLEVKNDNSYTANGIAVHNCQAFSIAGHRMGFDDARGTLFFEIARILRDKRPQYFILENVRNLLSHDGGRTFKTIIKILADMGYYVEWEVYNSKDYQTPQRRERIFIKGYHRTGSGRKILPFRKNSRKSMEIKPIQLNNHKKTYQDGRIYDFNGASICLNARGNNGWYQISDTEYMPVTKTGDAFALTTRHRSMPLKKHQDNYVISSKNRARKLTPIECERLQKFPDNWTKYGKDGEIISDTQRYKCIGNAVTTSVITAIVDEMFQGDEDG